MGMYTELIFGVSLKKDTPKEVIETLQYMVGDIDRPYKLSFEAERNPLRGGSYYFAINNDVNKMWFDKISLEWIKPYISDGSGVNDFYAIVTHEGQEEPTIYYLKD